MEAPASVPAPQPPDMAAKPASRPAYKVGELCAQRPLQLHLEPLEPRYQMAGFDTTTKKR
jgi:hypothetical protein